MDACRALAHVTVIPPSLRTASLTSPIGNRSREDSSILRDSTLCPHSLDLGWTLEPSWVNEFSVSCRTTEGIEAVSLGSWTTCKLRRIEIVVLGITMRAQEMNKEDVCGENEGGTQETRWHTGLKPFSSSGAQSPTWARSVPHLVAKRYLKWFLVFFLLNTPLPFA